MTYGEYRRALPRLQIRKGFEGNETRGLQFSAPLATGVTVLSGQVISLNSTGQWVLGAAAGAVPYMAYHDSTDTDVLSSGLLLGLSCIGQYVFSTGYFVKADGNFIGNDLPLKASTVVPGSLTLSVAPGGGTIDEDAADIIGFTSLGGQEQVGPYLDGNGNFIPAINTEALPIGGPTYLVSFTAHWLPKRTVAA